MPPVEYVLCVSAMSTLYYIMYVLVSELIEDNSTGVTEEWLANALQRCCALDHSSACLNSEISLGRILKRGLHEHIIKCSENVNDILCLNKTKSLFYCYFMKLLECNFSPIPSIKTRGMMTMMNILIVRVF